MFAQGLWENVHRILDFFFLTNETKEKTLSKYQMSFL